MLPVPSPHSRPSLDVLVGQQSQCQLISYTFENKRLRFQMFFDQAGLLEFSIPTDTVYARSVPTDPKRASCRMKLVDLDHELLTKAGRYLPPTSTATLVTHARDRVTLAYGRKIADAKFLFFLQGEYTLIACLIQEIADISWTSA